jgi:hypothetical protein
MMRHKDVIPSHVTPLEVRVKVDNVDTVAAQLPSPPGPRIS